MYHHMYGSWDSGWDSLWMTLMMLLWVAVIGGIVYAAVRMALAHQRDEQNRHQPPLGQ